MAAGGFFAPVFIFNETIRVKKQRTFVDPLAVILIFYYSYASSTK